jgi:hypothetical protein
MNLTPLAPLQNEKERTSTDLTTEKRRKVDRLDPILDGRRNY